MAPPPTLQRVLTGITTTGTPHLGNYVGAIRPCIRASAAPDVQSFFFMADYHALIKCEDPARIARSRLEIAALWIAAGLDTERAIFYRQSDVPEITELCWLLTCVTSKGLMNRAHAYKGATDAALAAGEEPDAHVTMGLFSYPILMAADILMFNAHRVPVGRDQVQHIEMARDIAERFNRLYAPESAPLFTLPQAEVDEDIALLPGLDGRKMSKSYGNTIPLLEGGAEALKEAVARIVTDSLLPGEPKSPEGTPLVTLYDAFATPEERAQFRRDLIAGLAWGEAKARLVARIEHDIGPMRARYDHLMAHPEAVESILQEGARKARAVAQPFLRTLREAVGLRPLQARSEASAAAAIPTRVALPRFKQYRDREGQFYFKLLDAEGGLLLQSQGFETGKDAGVWVARLKQDGAACWTQAPVQCGPNVTPSQVVAAFEALTGAD